MSEAAEIIAQGPGTTDYIIVERRGNAVHLTMNYPQARNALSQPETFFLADQLERAAADDSVRLVVLRGADGHFSAGGRVDSFGKTAPPGEETLSAEEKTERRVQRLIRCGDVSMQLYRMPKPTVALVRGAAAGVGMTFAMACDFRLASDTALFTTAFARVGVSGDMGSSLILQSRFGPALARELLFLSDKIPAEKALEIGLVNRLYPDVRFEAEADAFLQRLLDGPPLAYAAFKRNLIAAAEGTVAEALEIEARNMVRTLESADCREAAISFKERRAPTFNGK